MSTPPPEEGRPDEPLAWPDDLTVPDDISGLEADIEALRRERAAARRRGMAHRLLFPGSRRGTGVSVAMLLVALLLVSSFGALLVLLVPSPGGLGAPAALPLARPATPPGSPGGLLPALDLRLPGGRRQPARDLARPAAIVLVPAGCSCPDGVRHALGAAATYGLHEFVVGLSDADTQRYTAPDSALATGLVDDAGALVTTYGVAPGGPTLLVLARDGVVAAVSRGVAAGSGLAGALQLALRPAGGAR